MDAISAPILGTAPRVDNKKLFYTTIASTLAWACDLFDLFIILFVAPTIGELFFPSNNPMLSLASVYGAYAVTVVMRPIGSAIFGSYADRSGRRRAMIVAVTGIGVVTGMMGLLPTFPQAGIWAPVLFLALRIIQGVFVGGVTATSHTIAAETVPPKMRGIITGIVATGAAIGSLFASAAYWLVSLMFPGESFAVWGWRTMFFFGLVPLLLSALIYCVVRESPLWLETITKGKKSRTPLREAYSRQNLGANTVTLMLVIGGGIQIYLTQSYLPAFLKLINKVPNANLGAILMVANFAAIAATPLFGHLSQIFGRKRIFLALGLANLVLIPYCYVQLSHLTPDAIGLIYLYAGILTFCGNAPLGPMIIFLNERFPTKVRATGVAVSWSIGFAIGGMMPTFVTLASRSAANIPSTLITFLLGAILLYIAGAILVPETRGNM
jgi:MFS transporter, MHS family, proline/betaine transporter